MKPFFSTTITLAPELVASIADDKPAPPAPIITISVSVSSAFMFSGGASLAVNVAPDFFIASATLFFKAKLVSVAPVTTSTSVELVAIMRLVNSATTGSVNPDSELSTTLISFISEFSNVTSTLNAPYLPVPSPWTTADTGSAPCTLSGCSGCSGVSAFWHAANDTISITASMKDNSFFNFILFTSFL